MPTSEPLHIAFVWHMHQPYYRSSSRAPFDMPWARMHALKDYLDMVEILSGYPDLHQTFNLVPSLVEQLETYAAGGFADTYWEHTLRPAKDLEPTERAFIVERMCEHPDHPRARSYPRYLELALKREAHATQGWDAPPAAFTVDELRDLQIWFNLAWFDPQSLGRLPLSDLVSRGSNFGEDDKTSLAEVQQDLLARTLPAYVEAATRGQIEISTSPYFHPILPLLINTDSARVAAADLLLPRRRFAHPEDALEQVQRGIAKHEAVFGAKPRGIWCSEQAVGEDVIPLLLRSGFDWTISDESVLTRSLSGVSRPTVPGGPGAPAGGVAGSLTAPDLYAPYRLEREGGALSIVFRDHTLSDLIGFAYSSWNSRDAAADLIRRLREIRDAVSAGAGAAPTASTASRRASPSNEVPLVTIALDGENAWEYYPRDGRDFLQYLYEGLSADPDLRCVTISEHLRESPPTRSLDWLHTGSWIGADLGTWIGDLAHGIAWELLHEARDAVSRAAAAATADTTAPDTAEAWQHILAAEGSDWFWWFGEHHHTQLNAVWDSNFRSHLEETYRLLGKNVPLELFFPIIADGSAQRPLLPQGPVSPVIDGVIGSGADGSADEWAEAGFLAQALPSTMQRAEGTDIREVRFGWSGHSLCLLIVPDSPLDLRGLEIQVEVIRPPAGEGLLFLASLDVGGLVRTECKLCPQAALDMAGAWKDVVELSLPVPGVDSSAVAAEIGLVVRTGRDGMTEHLFHSVRLGSQEWVTK